MNKKTILMILAVLTIGISFLVLRGDALIKEPNDILEKESELFLQNEEGENGNNSNNIQESVEGDEMVSFVRCLIDQDVVVYASKTCPACTSFANEFGGYGNVEGLFIECGNESARCSREMKTGYVPEIQIKGEVYEGRRDLETLSQVTNCEL